MDPELFSSDRLYMVVLAVSVVLGHFWAVRASGLPVFFLKPVKFNRDERTHSDNIIDSLTVGVLCACGVALPVVFGLGVQYQLAVPFALSGGIIGAVVGTRTLQRFIKGRFFDTARYNLVVGGVYFTVLGTALLQAIWK
jgi:predicted membrane protein